MCDENKLTFYLNLGVDFGWEGPKETIITNLGANCERWKLSRVIPENPQELFTTDME